ncbi:TspO/MBR related protein [Nocardioides sp. J9]|uniref:TspO/MBR family protein n=1 Tax=unclassified Nocardioides TaxID=2615069 RepID=UPI00048D24DC|nr:MULTISPECIES: TspO/MBR family protein [unclassified Nocardioides]TWH03171.1 TspO/MBR related protein [Nocardioides sp. J9]
MATATQDHAPAGRPDRPLDKATTWLGLVPFAVAVAAVSALGGLASTSSRATYKSLDQPWFAPPSWLFGPMWTILYVLIAIAGWWAWRKHAGNLALVLWSVQLALNLAWTPLFFAEDLYTWALAEIVVLLAAIAATIVVFFRRGARGSGWLMVPYLLWVGYATALNAAIVVLN